MPAAESGVRNPFHTLYVTEALETGDAYWRWFSPEIITGEITSLFRPGNTVLLGTNGAGKTMLLRLFSPEVCAAFLRSKRDSPIPEADRRFLSIGVHVIHDGFAALGGRALDKEDADVNRQLWALIVGDLLNYHFVAKLVDTLSFLCTADGKPLAGALGLDLSERRLRRFARQLAAHHCWQGALATRSNLAGLRAGLRGRINAYRNWFNWNSDTLPKRLTGSKSEIGEPLTAARNALTECGIAPPGLQLVVTIDQYESLVHTDYETREGPVSFGHTFCRVVNSFIAGRNPRVSYKVGVRPYSWGRELRALGTDAKLELKRDYQRVDLDGVLRRKENTEAWIFPQFARDVASRRIAVSAGNRDPAEFQRWLDDRLEVLVADAELARYCKDDAERLLPALDKLPPSWSGFIRAVYSKSRFKALVVATWIQQALGRGEPLPEEPPATFAAGEWAREWWQKERREAILVQAASRCRQRRLYGGMDAILTMTGSNILVFISLCREIWDSWERANAKSAKPLSSIGADIQSQAIWTVSEEWVGKQTEFPDGHRRKDFLVRLGVGVRRALLQDKGLVYPGHTGFSLLLDDYESEAAEETRRFLDGATDFGALVSLPHTTKEKNRRQRRKWYLFPILCPHFEVPAVRTKEPYYARLAEVQRWISDRRPDIILRRPHSKTRRGRTGGREAAQLDLFGARPEGSGR